MDDTAKMGEMPKKQALQDIIKAMKDMKLQKIKGYAAGEDASPTMEIEVQETDKEKDPLKQAMSPNKLDDNEEEEG